MTGRTIPIAPQPAGGEVAGGGCEGAECFALMVLGDSMLPEFADGEVVVIEPGGLATDGSYVLARVGQDWLLRQLRREGDQWRLVALHPGYPDIPIDDLAPVRGVVIQKARPGRRRETRRYVE